MSRRIALVLVVLVLGGCARAISGTPVAGQGLECPRSTAALVACLSMSLSAFWTRELHRPVAVDVHLDPTLAQVPPGCRAALGLHTAFSCPVDDAVYLTAPFVRRLRSAGPPGAAWLRIAATTAHETGHVVQFAVRSSAAFQQDSGNARSRAVEQQADCLAGVWASSVGIAAARFRAATAAVLGVVSSRWEQRTHGSPAQRLAALRRGQLGRSPAACHLVLR